MSPISIRICVQYLVTVTRSDGRVERKRGYRHTDSWHEWVQDNFYGGSSTKRMVIKEPSLRQRTQVWPRNLFPINAPGMGRFQLLNLGVLGYGSGHAVWPARVIFFPIIAPGMGRFQLLNLGVLGYGLELRFWVVIAIIVSLTLTITLITTLTIILP